VLQRVRTVFDWCKAKEFRAGDNPALGIAKVLPKHRRSQTHHAALPYQEMQAFIETVRTAPAAQSVRLAFEFTILCATRTSETLLVTWPEINLESKTWTIPAARMKAASNTACR
jgi:integrase